VDLDRGDFEGDFGAVFFSLEWTWIGGILRGIFKNLVEQSSSVLSGLGSGGILRGIFKNLVEQSSSVLSGLGSGGF
jgi:hypothetical protein